MSRLGSPKLRRLTKNPHSIGAGIKNVRRRGVFEVLAGERQLLSALPIPSADSFQNKLEMLPTATMAAIQARAISANMTAYSTVVTACSRFRKLMMVFMSVTGCICRTEIARGERSRPKYREKDPLTPLKKGPRYLFQDTELLNKFNARNWRLCNCGNTLTFYHGRRVNQDLGQGQKKTPIEIDRRFRFVFKNELPYSDIFQSLMCSLDSANLVRVPFTSKSPLTLNVQVCVAVSQSMSEISAISPRARRTDEAQPPQVMCGKFKDTAVILAASTLFPSSVDVVLEDVSLLVVDSAFSGSFLVSPSPHPTASTKPAENKATTSKFKYFRIFRYSMKLKGITNSDIEPVETGILLKRQILP